MTWTPDFLIVGSGLTGAVIGRTLADAGQSVLILDRRSSLGGNVHDHVHESGIRVHTYGPHYFRTNDDAVWAFVSRFANFYKYEAQLKAWIDGKYENWPIAESYIRHTVGKSWSPAFTGEPRNFEEASLAMMPRVIYEKFVKGYTEKQWGVPAQLLSASLAKRFDVRHDNEPRLMRHKYQGIPERGYTEFMKRLLEGVPVLLNCDYLRYRDQFHARKLVVFSGPIDEYFGFDLGRLKYRGQRRRHEYLADVDFAQPCGQVNNPDPMSGPHIRTLEWKHMMPQEFAARIRGTLLTRETTVTPADPNDYEYPFPDTQNRDSYKAYRQRAEQQSAVLFCGRLGEYRYYDMDQAIARAQLLATRILTGEAARPEPYSVDRITVARRRRADDISGDAADSTYSIDPGVSVVEPIEAGVRRPLWSVMIPTYNCAQYLRQTLETVLGQDPGGDEMQIEVVDDCSTKDDPEAIVREVGEGRVTFYQNPANIGATRNFNVCIQRSRGQLVHILHGDDYVLPGFYRKLAAVAQAHSDFAFLATRTFAVDEAGVILWVSDELPALERGGDDATPFFYATPVQAAGVVVRRAFYEQSGGFLPSLVHVADREMWARVIDTAGGVITREVLACYRIFSGNDSSRLIRTAENLRDIERLSHVFASRYPAFERDRSMELVCRMALKQAHRLGSSGDVEAASVNLTYWKTHAPLQLKLRSFAGNLARNIVHNRG